MKGLNENLSNATAGVCVLLAGGRQDREVDVWCHENRQRQLSPSRAALSNLLTHSLPAPYITIIIYRTLADVYVTVLPAHSHALSVFLSVSLSCRSSSDLC